MAIPSSRARRTGHLSSLLAASALALSASAMPTAAAHAADFPTKPVTIVVPYPPGGSPDQLARAIAQHLGQVWGQTVVVDNRAGAAGNIAASTVARAKPDGYTLLLGSDGPLAINPLIHAQMPFDPAKDFAPISLAATVEFVLVAAPSVPASTVKEFVEYAKTHQPALAYASSGVGSQHHLGMELFKTESGLDLKHTPYRGSPPALADVMGDHVSVMFTAIPSAAAYIRGKRLKALAVTGLARSALLPDTPTMSEAGFKGFELKAWFGLSAPAGTPPLIVDQISADLTKALSAPEARSTLSAAGFNVVTDSPAEFGRFIKSESVRWAQVANAAGVKPE